MMEKRLKLARRLLKPDSTLVVTIDEKEVSHLGILLEQIFQSARCQLVTIVTNTAGATSPDQFSRAEEYAYFCRFGSDKPSPMATDLLSGSTSPPQVWFPFHRARGINDRPSKRPNLVYPVLVDRESLQVENIGRSLEERRDAGEIAGDLDEWLPDDEDLPDGSVAVWPILDTGEMSVWQAKASTLRELIADGFFRVRVPNQRGPRPLTFAYVKKGNRQKVLEGTFSTIGYEKNGARIIESMRQDTIAKTVWKVPTHDARIYGTTTLRELIGQNEFSYPKSPYAVLDTLKTIVGNKSQALILDFFAGSGTTLHAALLLNEIDGGKRQCIIVTNNEISSAEAKDLEDKGFGPESSEWRTRGIFHAVTCRRIRAAITGRSWEGNELSGEYVEPAGKRFSSGLAADADFLRLRYLDPEALLAEDCFDKVHSMLWAMAGCVGSCPTVQLLDDQIEKHEPGYLLPDGSVIPLGCRYAVLLRESRFSGFASDLGDYDDVTYVWLQARSDSSFAEMRSMLPERLKVGWLFRDMYRHFDRIRTGRSG